jgi:hypothetical protein
MASFAVLFNESCCGDLDEKLEQATVGGSTP